LTGHHAAYRNRNDGRLLRYLRVGRHVLLKIQCAAPALPCCCAANVSIRQHTSAYVSIPCAAYVSIRLHTSAYVSIRQHTSAYVAQHTSAYVSIRAPPALPCCCAQETRGAEGSQHTSAYVSIRQHTSAYVSIRQHTHALPPRCALKTRRRRAPGERSGCKEVSAPELR
jgi:hypothetical protein